MVSFSNSPLSGSVARYTHMADALRLLLVHRYGGFYADTDYVIIRPLTGLHNVVASDQITDDNEFNSAGHRLQGIHS